MDKKKILFSVFAVLVVLFIGYYAYRRYKQQSFVPPAYIVSDVSTFAVPRGFPQGLPVPPGSALLKNYTVSDPASGQQLQAVQVYKIPHTSNEVFGLFKTYFFTTRGWTILNEVNGSTGAVSIFAQNPAGVLTVSISPDATDRFSSTAQLDFSLQNKKISSSP